MRTLQVVNVRWFNATAWYGLTLARLLNQAGHPTLVLTLPGTEPHQRAQDWGLPHAGLPLNTTKPWQLPGLLAAMRRTVREFKPDVVNCHRGESFVLWGGLRRLGGGYALVRTRGDQRPPKANLPNRWLHNHAAAHVVATCSAIAGHLQTRLGVPSHRLSVIHGGVDTQAFAFDPKGRERVRAGLGYAPDDVVAGLVGRLDTVKGQREALIALARARKLPGGERLKLLLMGFGTATVPESEVHGWITQAGLAEHVRITGRLSGREDVAAHMAALDLGIAPSLGSETIARAPLELMANGRPVLASRVGCLPDILEGEALLDLDAGGKPTQALAAALHRAATDQAWLKRLRRAQEQRLAGLTQPAFLQASLAAYAAALNKS